MGIDVVDDQVRLKSGWCRQCEELQRLLHAAAARTERLRAEVAELRRLSPNGPRQFAEEEVLQ
jgi:hypothetical protein